MRVFRVENTSKEGPYADDGPLMQFAFETDGPAGKSVKHPTMFAEDDPLSVVLALGGMRSLVFGFSSRAQVFAWFYDRRWVQAMRKAGFSLVELEIAAEDVLEGNGQVMFKRSDAVFIARETLGVKDKKPSLRNGIDNAPASR